ncbi:RagB/SusD family nutrient uptake outer membrane protein [Arenibacter sp. P308M17]
MPSYGFREDQDYLSPIPQDELILNPNLEQNPNW